ncbi:NADH dehydrogenase [ubiquinone] iron-sulfur protein 6, mitochondrial-like [Penaeus monodon]|uniref:NADH dehydrogenase [ubiquinone] iron-sulfur protein 6, mitochondrial-like n=1 Tax=Penaeus monodon TaxID=6687 RepID=UPI0018A745A9|nr:NADH dehydrogenase [ubiquinone] iron-sulfur protein 6, mitochondrial-like [Penaeus monodon]
MAPNQLFNMASAGLFVSRNLRNIARLPGNCRALQTSCVARDASPTHTGQKFDENDVRNARFEVTPRQTNPRWSINLIKEVPPKAVNTRIVACDGGPGALGHPRVYINLDQPGTHDCIYCGLRYYKEDSH